MKLPYNLLETIELLIAKRQEIRDQCEKFIKNVEEQEKAINLLKAILTAAGIYCTISRQTGKTVVEIVEFIHLIFGLGEFTIKVSRDLSLREMLASDKQLAEKLSEDLRNTNTIVDKLMKLKEKDRWSRKQAIKNVLWAISNNRKIKKAKIRGEVDFLNTALEDNIDKIEIKDNITREVLKTGLKIAGTKALSSIPGTGTVINITECLCTLFSDDPIITSAKEAIKAIDNSIVELQQKKHAIESFKF